MANETFSGARALFSRNGLPVGYSKSFSGREAYQYDARHVLGLLQCAENVVVSYSADCTATFFRLLGKDAQSQGFMSTLENALTDGSMSVAVTDKLTSQTPYLFVDVRGSDNSFSVDSGSLVNETQSFVCIRRMGESQVPLAA